MATADTAADRMRRQRGRSIAIALSLGMLVVLFYGATMVRLGKNVAPADSSAATSGRTPGATR